MAKLKNKKDAEAPQRLSYDPQTGHWSGIPAGVSAEYFSGIKGTDTLRFVTNVPRVDLLTDGLYEEGPVARVNMKVKDLPDGMGIMRHQADLIHILGKNGAYNENTASQIEEGNYVEVPDFDTARRIAEGVERLSDKYMRINEQMFDAENPRVHYDEKTGLWSGVPTNTKFIDLSPDYPQGEVLFVQVNSENAPTADDRIYLVHNAYSAGADVVRVNANDRQAEVPVALGKMLSDMGYKEPLLLNESQYYYEFSHYADAEKFSKVVSRAEETLARSRGKNEYASYLDTLAHERSISFVADKTTSPVWNAYGNDALLVSAFSDIPLSADGSVSVPKERIDIIQRELSDSGYAVEYRYGGLLAEINRPKDVVAPKPDMGIGEQQMRAAITDFILQNGSFERVSFPKSILDDYDIELRGGNRLGMVIRRGKGLERVNSSVSYELIRNGKPLASFHDFDSHLTPGEVRKVYAAIAAGPSEKQLSVSPDNKINLIDSFIDENRNISEHEALTGERPDTSNEASANIPGTNMEIYRSGSKYILSDLKKVYADFSYTGPYSGKEEVPANTREGIDTIYSKILSSINSGNRQIALADRGYIDPERNTNRFVTSSPLLTGRWHSYSVNEKRLWQRYGNFIADWQQKMLGKHVGNLSPEYYNITRDDSAVASLMKTIHAAYYNLKTPVYVSETELAKGSFRVKSSAVPIPLENKNGIIENFYNIEDTDIPVMLTKDRYKEIVSRAREEIGKLQKESADSVRNMLVQGKWPEGVGVADMLKGEDIPQGNFEKAIEKVTVSLLPGDPSWLSVNDYERDTTHIFATWMNEIRYGFPDKNSFPGLTTVSTSLTNEALDALRDSPEYTQDTLEEAGRGITDNIVTEAYLSAQEASQKESASVSLSDQNEVSKENGQEESQEEHRPRGLHL